MEIIENLFRTLMFFFDNIIYGLIPTIYKLFIYLSNINLFTTSDTNPLYQLIEHVYVLLGIFMLFKVSFSLLQYLVNPNDFSDSSKGVGKLVTNVLVVLVLLVSVPYIFNKASELQSTIVQKNIIGQLILGTTASGGDSGDSTITANKAEVMAKDLQFMLYGAFFKVNSSIEACKNTSGVLGSIDMASDSGCLDYLNIGIAEEDNAAANGVTLYSFFKHAPSNNGTDEGENCDDETGVCDDRNFGDLGSLLWWKEEGTYVIDFLPFVSSAVGVYVVFLLISFSVDIAVRAIKLCFLQMVAPIAIVSYIDPKESMKDGKLHNWIHECFTTYVSLFLRLATMFFIMLLVQMIASSVLSNGQGESYIATQIPEDSYNIWIYLFLVIGAFMFAKELPKLIESIFGIKGSGDLHLNPFKNAGAASLVGGVVGAGVGGIASSIASAKTASITGDNKFKAGLGGFVKGTVGGVMKGRKWDGSGMSSLVSAPFAVSGDVARYQAAKHGTKFRDRAEAMFNEAVGAPQKADIMKKRIDNANKFTKLFGAVDSGMSAKMSKLKDIRQFTSKNSATNAANFKKISDYNYLKSQLDAAVQRGDAATIANIQNGTYSDSSFNSSGIKFSDYEDTAKQTMYDMITNGEVLNDSEIQSIKSNIDTMKRVGKENASAKEFADVNDNIYVTDSKGTAMAKMKKASKSVDTAKTITENSDEYENAQAASEAVKANRMFDFVTKK